MADASAIKREDQPLFVRTGSRWDPPDTLEQQLTNVYKELADSLKSIITKSARNYPSPSRLLSMFVQECLLPHESSLGRKFDARRNQPR